MLSDEQSQEELFKEETLSFSSEEDAGPEEKALVEEEQSIEQSIEQSEEEEAEDIEPKKVGRFMGTLKVTIYDNIPATVEMLDLQPNFSFKHLKFARRAFQRALARRRREAAKVETPIEREQNEAAERQALLDQQIAEKLLEAKAGSVSERKKAWELYKKHLLTKKGA